MTTRYYIEYYDGANWICEHLKTPTPETLSAAADLLEYVIAEHGATNTYRVTVSCAPYDKTDEVLNFIDARNEEAAREAAEDEAHERSERHSWEQV